MNNKFYKAISDMKTASNANLLEAVKNLYVLCEGVKNPVGSSAFLSEAKTYLEQQSAVHPGVSVSKNSVSFDTDNGKARIVVADFENATIEVSPLAESQFYPIGTTKLSDGLGSAYTMAMNAINDDAMMEGILSKMNQLR